MSLNGKKCVHPVLDVIASMCQRTGKNFWPDPNKKLCCSCSKVKCLKRYCECFQAGRFCDGCDCVDCHNQPQYIDEIRKIAKGIQEKDNLAFFVDTARQGCNCKKNNCRKAYCECFQAGVLCSDYCFCVDCHNGRDDSPTFLPVDTGSDTRRVTAELPRKRRKTAPESIDYQDDPPFWGPVEPSPFYEDFCEQEQSQVPVSADDSALLSSKPQLAYDYPQHGLPCPFSHSGCCLHLLVSQTQPGKSRLLLA